LIPIREAVQISMFDKTIRSEVALELSASWPFPVKDPSRLVVFYYSTFVAPKRPNRIYPPQWRTLISADDGKVVSVEKRKPADFGVSGPPDVPMAEHSYPKDWTQEFVDGITSELTVLCDDLYPAWLTGRSSQEPAIRRSILAFRKLFPDWAARPMLVCYRHVAPEFFAWAQLDNV
jgi:hypothetical protein